MLRLQNERMSGALLPSPQEYFKSYGLTPERLALAKPDAIVMHPGPMNRGVEIDSAVADGAQAVILPQVTFGIAVRMAVMSIVAGNEAASACHEDPDQERPRDRSRPRSFDAGLRRGAWPPAGSLGVGTAPAGFEPEPRIDASGCIVAPGLVDLAARLREPGYEYKATLESEMPAAVAGGVTSLVCPPDTDPVLDEPGLVEMLKHRAEKLHQARVFPLGALTRGLRARC